MVTKDVIALEVEENIVVCQVFRTGVLRKEEAQSSMTEV